MEQKDILITVYVILSLLAIGILTYFVVTCPGPEKFCLCQGMGREVCPNRELLSKLYRNGDLTEYTDFSKIQKANGGAAWSDDIDDFSYYQSL